MTVIQMVPKRTMEREINRLFNHLTRIGENSYDLDRSGNSTAWHPPLDITERPADYFISLEIPGVEEENLRLSYQENLLIIEGEKSPDTGTQTEDYIHTERCFGSFRRQVRLGEEIEQNGIEARFANGVLEISVPKSRQSKERDIPVKYK